MERESKKEMISQKTKIISALDRSVVKLREIEFHSYQSLVRRIFRNLA
jgi:hypothetical protein